MLKKEYPKYQHLERLGTTEVSGIEIGKCHVFPKLDGSNGVLFLSDNKLTCGSRTRVVTAENDNQGFAKYMSEHGYNHERLLLLLEEKFQCHAVLYGEWLVPHSFRWYEDYAWNKFYVFDVYVGGKPISYDKYQPMLEYFGIDHVPCVSIIRNGAEMEFIHEMNNRSTFLCKEGVKKGEGIVIKNYDYVNQFGRTVWAKIVSNEFKAIHQKAMGPLERNLSESIEYLISEKYCTEALCHKEYHKIAADGWSSRNIPQLLNTIYYCIVKEDCWEFVNEHKNPVINFKSLQQFVFHKVKNNLPTLF